MTTAIDDDRMDACRSSYALGLREVPGQFLVWRGEWLSEAHSRLSPTTFG